MTEQIDACPECDGTYIYTRTGKSAGRMDDTAPTRFRCRECGAEFEEPNTRPAQRGTVGQKGPGKLLADADPEDWP